MRYSRCQTETCRRKWHNNSLVYERGLTTKPAGDLFASPKAVHATGCPACGGKLEPEHGTFEELFTDQEAA